MENVVIYTCITGGYDSLMQPSDAPEGFRFVCFTDDCDRPCDGLWELRKLPAEASGDMRRQSRYPKFMPHVLFPESEYSLWIDANVCICDSAFYGLIERKIASGVMFSAVCHPLRDDVYEEAMECIRSGRARLKDMEDVCGFLLDEGYPEHSGLTENNLILRKHNDPKVREVDELWNQLFDRFPFRDQLLLGFCMKSAGLQYDLLLPPGTSVRNHPYLRYVIHPRKSLKLRRLATQPVRNADAAEFGNFIERFPRYESLAIVIPAYRSRFLRQTLDSISDQADKRFVVYVGDDASPEDLKGICDMYAGKIDIRYTRFGDNMGGHDLVAQWARCVTLSTEDWVWLFSDDDTMSPDCTATFHRTCKHGKSLLRFNIDVIDRESNVIERCDFPPHVSASRFVSRRAVRGLRSYAVEYVFRRQDFLSSGGFVNFDLAWNSDDATWVRLASMSGGIHTMNGGRVQWRRSGSNITSENNPSVVERKMKASLDYVAWLKGMKIGNRMEMLIWFVTNLFYFRANMTAEQRWNYMSCFAQISGGGRFILNLERMFYRYKSMRYHENIHISDL